MNKNSWRVAILVAAASLSACGGKNTPPLTPARSTEVAPDGLSYPDPNLFTQGVEIEPLVPTVRGTPTNYMVVPDLPAGLRLGPDGRITGTPTEPKGPGTYLVTAGNSAGVSSFGVRITVIGRFTVGGTVFGLAGDGLVLVLNDAHALAISETGRFTFDTTLGTAQPYNVAIDAQPAGQTCSIANGSGTITNINVAGVNVTCQDDAQKATRPSTFGATLADLASGGRELHVTCAADGGPPRLEVFDRGTGLVTALDAPSYQFEGAAPGAPCGRDAVTLDPDEPWVYVTQPSSRTVSVFAAGAEPIARVVVRPD